MRRPDAGAAVPDQLLVPLLDVAADVLRALEPAEVPAALRALAAFDRRGLSNSAARHQLRRALDLDDGFRARVAEALSARPEVKAALEGWTAEHAITRAQDAAARDDLGVLTAALYVVQPDGFEFPAQRTKVINRTVEYNAQFAVIRRHRLMTCRAQIENRKTAMSKNRFVPNVDSLIVGTAMF